MDWHTALKGSIALALGVPALFAIMSFVVWQNGFKMLGWKYIARLTLVMAIFPWILEAIDAYKATS